MAEKCNRKIKILVDILLRESSKDHAKWFENQCRLQGIKESCNLLNQNQATIRYVSSAIDTVFAIGHGALYDG